MKKQLFTESINAIKNQHKYDIEFAKNLNKVFPDCFEANLLPCNHFLSNQLMKVLQTEMNDLALCEHGQSWIEYFCFKLDFGKKYKKGQAINKDGSIINLSDSGQLWEILKNGGTSE